MPPFDFVSDWFHQQQIPIISDIQRVNIIADTELGSFEALILAVLYSSEIHPLYAEQTIMALRENNLTDINMWCNIQDDNETWKTITGIFINHYQGGKFRNNKTNFIRHNAAFTLIHLNRDIRQIYNIYNGNEIIMLKYLRNNFKGIRQKAFWFLREMRMNGIWNVRGQYCCVPDKQVGRSLERWGYINEFNSAFNTHLHCSQIVWNYFGEMYDFPVLHYSREHRCNSMQRRCEECQILDCNDRLIG